MLNVTHHPNRWQREEGDADPSSHSGSRDFRPSCFDSALHLHQTKTKQGNIVSNNSVHRKGLWFMCTLCCAPSYTERPEICVEMCSEFALFQSCLLGHSCPLVHAPLQGHRYCPLAKSVRPSLTQIRFLPKWDFYCSIRAGSRISLPQPFPVSSRRGSAALLQFFFSSFLPPPSPASSPGQIWNTDCKKLCLCRPSLDFKEWKEFLKKKRKKKKRDTLPLRPPFYTSSHTNTGSNIHTDFASYILMCPLWAISLGWRVCWCVVTCDPEAKLSHGASARSLFCYRRENSSLYAGSVGSYIWSAQALKWTVTEQLNTKYSSADRETHQSVKIKSFSHFNCVSAVWFCTYLEWQMSPGCQSELDFKAEEEQLVLNTSRQPRLPKAFEAPTSEIPPEQTPQDSHKPGRRDKSDPVAGFTR